MHSLYILESDKKNIFYIGSSSDVYKRLREHNSGGTKSTKPYRPWRIIYIEEYVTKSEARKREWYLKHPRGYLEKKAIIRQYGSLEASHSGLVHRS